MTKKLVALLILLMTGAAIQAQTPAFDELRSKFDQQIVFKADFTHTHYINDSLQYDSPDQLRITFINLTGYVYRTGYFSESRKRDVCEISEHHSGK